jgi:hypothetical protein
MIAAYILAKFDGKAEIAKITIWYSFEGSVVGMGIAHNVNNHVIKYYNRQYPSIKK